MTINLVLDAQLSKDSYGVNKRYRLETAVGILPGYLPSVAKIRCVDSFMHVASIHYHPNQKHSSFYVIGEPISSFDRVKVM